MYLKNRTVKNANSKKTKNCETFSDNFPKQKKNRKCKSLKRQPLQQSILEFTEQVKLNVI